VDDELPLAKELGPEYMVHAALEDPVQAVPARSRRRQLRLGGKPQTGGDIGLSRPLLDTVVTT
jgi:hypothetical protein